jgi:hypothetical protein
MKQAEPLHLPASLFDQECERSSEILKQVGVCQEAVIAELRSSEVADVIRRTAPMSIIENQPV